jgi:hypothetical protein
MKGLLTALTVVSLLAITSVTHAHDTRHEKERVGSRHDSPAIVKVLFSSSRGPAYGMHQNDQRYRGQPAHMRNWPFWKKVKYMQKLKYKNNRNDRHDKHARYDRHKGKRHNRDKHDRHDRYNGNNWYDKYFQ